MKKRNFVIAIVSLVLTMIMSFDYIPMNQTINFNNFSNSGSIFWLLVWMMFAIVINNTFNTKNKRLLIISIFTGIIIATFYTIGHVFNYFVLSNVIVTLKLILFIFVKYIFNCAVSSITMINIYKFIDNYKENPNMKIKDLLTFNKKNFIILSIIIFICYIPWLLHYFPGICSSDSTRQMMLVTSKGVQMNNHHPVFHTFIIGICLKVGELFNNYNLGVATYSIIQMAACAFTFSYAVLYCEKRKVPTYIQGILLLFFMFSPIIASYSITMWKDIPFALCILITTIKLIDMCENPKLFFSKKSNFLILMLFLLLDILFRKNGIYCVLLAGLVITVVYFKKYKKQMLLVFLIPLVTGYIITGPLLDVFNIKQGNSREAVSVLMQQFAAIRLTHSDELTIEEKKIMDAFFEIDNYYELYDPVFADPIKRFFDEDYLNEHKKDLVIMYLKLAVKYPKTTIKAFISGSFGYYYPNIVGWEVFNTIFDDYTLEIDVKQTPIVEFRTINVLEGFLNSHNISVIGTLSSCGFYFLLLVGVIGYEIYQKRIRYILPTLLVIGVWGTALLSPVFCERRYVYSLFLVVPILFALCFRRKEIKQP